MAPARLWDWFIINLKIGLLSFGGGGRTMLYRDAIVEEKKWLDDDQFQEVLTLAQVLPGPNLVNLSAYFGHRLSGVFGSFLGILGLATPGAFGVIVLATLVDLSKPFWTQLFRGFSIGSSTLFTILIIALIRGLSVVSQDRVRSHKFKIGLRGILAFVVALASLTGQPLLPVLFSGIALGLILEFAT